MTDTVPQDRPPSRGREVIGVGALKVTSERDGEIHSIRLSGELDVATAGAVEDELSRVEATDASTIVIDLAGLTFMDSTGIRLLVNAAARTRKGNPRLALLRGGDAIQRVLQLTGLEDELPFTD
jgi:anti-sigma B factor antagonist